MMMDKGPTTTPTTTMKPKIAPWQGTPPGWIGFLAGCVAGCAMVAAMIGLRLAFAIPTYPELIGNALSANVPIDLFNLSVGTLGEETKPILFAVLVAITVLVGALLGMRYSVRAFKPAAPFVSGALWPAVRLAGTVWLLVVLIVSPLVGAGLAGDNLPDSTAYLFGGLGLHAVYAVVLAGMTWLISRAFAPPAVTNGSVNEGRRTLLHNAVLGASFASVAAAVVFVRRFAFPDHPEQIQESPARIVAQQIGATDRAAVGDSTDPAFALAAGKLPDDVTDSERHYVISKNFRDPTVKSAGWKITLDGLVDTPLTITYNDLIAMPTMTVLRTMECISNEIGGHLISTAQWTGVPLRDVLMRAGVRDGVTKVKFTATDGYSTALPLSEAMSDTTILAYQLNGDPLPIHHGYPARLIIPTKYGMKNPKWITGITLTTEDYKGYWERQGWTDLAYPETWSRIDTPRRGGKVGAPIAIGGTAYAGNRGIRRVEVSTDSGKTWAEAALAPPLGPFTWVFWAYTWTPAASGDYTLICRAYDGTNSPQATGNRDPIPDGATGLHRVKVSVSN